MFQALIQFLADQQDADEDQGTAQQAAGRLVQAAGNGQQCQDGWQKFHKFQIFSQSNFTQYLPENGTNVWIILQESSAPRNSLPKIKRKSDGPPSASVKSSHSEEKIKEKGEKVDNKDKLAAVEKGSEKSEKKLDKDKAVKDKDMSSKPKPPKLGSTETKTSASELPKEIKKNKPVSYQQCSCHKLTHNYCAFLL